MFRDDTLPSIGMSLTIEHDMEPLPPSPRLGNDNNLDDVFGSAPSSPNSQDVLDGVIHHSAEPSDIHRMRSEHSTSGYRDGLSSAKSTSVQEGFDEGYSLGAAFGLEVGALLGMLEGIHAAVLALGDDVLDDKLKMKELLDTARKDLKLEHIFSRKWWGEDGIWTYPVAEDMEDESEAFTFREVVHYHPLIMKWKKSVDAEVERWRLDVTVMERMEVKRMDAEDAAAEEAAVS